MAILTLSQLAGLRDANIAGIMQETASVFPLIDRLPTLTVPGTSANIPVVTGLPAGEYRSENAAHIEGDSTQTTRAVTLKYYDASWTMDEQIALGNYGGVEAACAFAAKQALLGAFAGIESGLLYGASGGLSGFKSLIPSSKTINAGGSTANTQSRVIAVNLDAVRLAVGQDGKFSQGEIARQMVPTNGGGYFWGWAQNIHVWSALAVMNYRGVGQIVNIDETKKLDDNLVYKLLGSFGTGTPAQALFMSKRSLEQLRESRTATNALGTPAPTPTDVAGVPIFALDTMLDTEAVTA